MPTGWTTILVFHRGVSGPELASLFRLQLAGMLVKVKTVEVTKLDFTGSEFRLFSGDQECVSKMIWRLRDQSRDPGRICRCSGT